MKLTPKKQEGFSILEIVISLLIVAVVFLLYNAALNTTLLTYNSNDQEIALRIAGDEIETLRHTTYTSLPANGSFSNSLLSSLPSGQANLTLSDYNSSSTKQILVDVSWLERGAGNRHNVSLSTLITQVGGLP